jgi:purine-cytosine permease-like protein
MAFHAAQGPTFGLPQMIQSRAQFGYRGVVVPLFATLFTYLAFNVADQVLLAEGLHGAYGWNSDLVAIVCSVGAGLLAVYGHDWVHRMFRVLLLISLALMTIVSLGVLFGAAGGHAPAHHLGFSTTAFLLVDFFFVRRGHYAITDLFTPRGIYGEWAWRGLTAYFAGFVCEIPFMILPDLGGWHYTGPLAKQLSDVDVSWVVGLAVSAAVYLVLSRSLDIARERAGESGSERELAEVVV